MTDLDRLRYGKGTLAEFCVVKTSQCKIKPASISFASAAALPLAGLTAYGSLIHRGKLKAGQRVFINGASGGVGMFAVQIAKAVGATVVATGSGDKADAVKAAGASDVIDYRTEDVPRMLKDRYGATEDDRFDLCFDCVGSYELYSSSSTWLKSSTGTYVNCGGDIRGLSLGEVWHFISNELWKHRPKILGGGPPYQMYHLDGSADGVTREGGDLHTLLQWLEEGKVKPEIDSEYRLEDYLAAYDRQMSNRVSSLPSNARLSIALSDYSTSSGERKGYHQHRLVSILRLASPFIEPNRSPIR